MILDLDDFDIILGMDWLSKYHACVDCFHKTITFPSEREVNCLFKGEWIITPLSLILSTKVEKMIKKGCIIWMATMKVEEIKEEKSATDVPVVREYLEVLPDDLSGL